MTLDLMDNDGHIQFGRVCPPYPGAVSSQLELSLDPQDGSLFLTDRAGVSILLSRDEALELTTLILRAYPLDALCRGPGWQQNLTAVSESREVRMSRCKPGSISSRALKVLQSNPGQALHIDFIYEHVYEETRTGDSERNKSAALSSALSRLTRFSIEWPDGTVVRTRHGYYKWELTG